MSTFLPFSILILLSTGWFSFLPVQLEITKRYIIHFLAIIVCISFLPPITISSSFEIRADLLCLCGLFLYFFTRTAISQMTLFSFMLMMGSILFLFHEVLQTSFMDRSSVFHWGTILFCLIGAIVSANKMKEQFCLVFGSLMITQGILTYLYHDQISPLVFPWTGTLDVFWVTIGFLIVVKRLQLWIPTLQKNWRLAYWIKKR